MTAPHRPSGKALGQPVTKAKKRSRQGCVNCKLRKVKCDEIKPACERCKNYDVLCTYKSGNSDLQLVAAGVNNFQIVKKLPSCLNLITLKPISPLTLPECSPFFRNQDLELLSKFQTRTVYTITFDKSLPIYQNETIKLASASPFLMHAVLVLTMMHDCYLGVGPLRRQSPAEAFNWSCSINCFNSKLSRQVQPHERDALWLTAALLGVMSFAFIDAETSKEAWPLALPSSLDLNWLKMSEGKKEIWDIIQPFRPDCVFQPLALQFTTFLPTPKGPGIETLPPQLIALYDLESVPTPTGNPYQHAASILAKSLNIDCRYIAMANFFSFVRRMEPEFKRLLERKDSRALLLLAYFYAQICQIQSWWMRRTRLECQAICIYLERNHQHEPRLQALLQFLKMICNTSESD